MIWLKKFPRNPQIWKLLKNSSTHTANVPRITASDCKNPVSSSYSGSGSLFFAVDLVWFFAVLFLDACADLPVVFAVDDDLVLADVCDCFVVSFCFLVPAKCFSPFLSASVKKCQCIWKNVKAVVKLIQCQKQISPFNRSLRLEQSLTASNFKHTRIPILHHNLLYRFLFGLYLPFLSLSDAVQWQISAAAVYNKKKILSYFFYI